MNNKVVSLDKVRILNLEKVVEIQDKLIAELTESLHTAHNINTTLTADFNYRVKIKDYQPPKVKKPFWINWFEEKE